MKFCTTCGEVYPPSAEECDLDGVSLALWTTADLSGEVDLYGSTDEVTALPLRGHGDIVEGDATVVQTRIKYGTAASERTQSRFAETTIARGKSSARRSYQARTPAGVGPAVTTPELATPTGEIGENTGVRELVEEKTRVQFDASAPQETPVPVSKDGKETLFLGMLVANRYRLDQRIGAGSFGVVFNAYDKKLDVRVAVKMLSPALANDTRSLTRFRREAIAAGRIKHPGIVEVSDFGIGGDAASYIVMEFLPGLDLSALIRTGGKLDPMRAMNICTQCAWALGAAHAAGVVHRDLKPANIFLIQDAKHQPDTVKIIDFGIAKDESSNPRLGNLTAVSKIVGTPHYMAPEQARNMRLDGRSDLYSLGVIFFEMLTGQRPFYGRNAYELLIAHAESKRPVPSVAVPGLRAYPGLDEIVLRAMAVDPADRFHSMGELAWAIDTCMRKASEQATSAARPGGHREGIRQELSRRLARHIGVLPVWGIGVALVVVLFAILVVVSNSGSDSNGDGGKGEAGESEAGQGERAAPDPAAASQH